MRSLFDFHGSAHFHRAAISLVVGVANGHTDVDVAAAEVEVVVGASVDREPIALFDVLAVGAEAGKYVFIVFGNDVGNGFAVRHDDLEIFVVDPDAALEVALVLFDGLGTNIENVAGELIDLLSANVGDVIFGKFSGREDEGLDIADVVEILLGEGDSLKGVGWSKGDVLVALAFGSKDDVAGHSVFAVGAVFLVESLDGEGLGVGVIIAFEFELRFFFGESLDDVFDGHGRGIFGDGIVAGGMDLFGRRRSVVAGILRRSLLSGRLRVSDLRGAGGRLG